MKRSAIVLLALGLLTACQEDVQVARPAALDLTPEAAGHYCQMTVLDHSGPKAQIHLTDNPNPFWFTQVRDAVAFTLSPEEPKNIAAIYVNDMEKAESWDQPGTDNWIEADSAWFVIGSTQAGGMGAAEAIPFGSQAGAERFVQSNGGSVVRFKEIPAGYVLESIDVTSAARDQDDGRNEVR